MSTTPLSALVYGGMQCVKTDSDWLRLTQSVSNFFSLSATKPGWFSDLAEDVLRQTGTLRVAHSVSNVLVKYAITMAAEMIESSRK